MSPDNSSRDPTTEEVEVLRERAVSEPGEVEDRSSNTSPTNSDDEIPANKDRASAGNAKAPPLPNEPIPGTEPESLGYNAPPLPSEPVPEPEDDGWRAHWNEHTMSFWFYNEFTGVWQQENPRVPDATAASAPAVSVPETQDKTAISDPVSVAGGYNPAIHGDYDENAWYAQNARAIAEPSISASALSSTDAAGGLSYANGAFFNRHTGQWQTADQGPERHSDEAKSRRQLNAYFDVDAAANMHDGRSLKAERAGKKPTKAELKMFKEKRRAKKEEKRRAWLRD